jgi:hypothetical protein
MRLKLFKHKVIYIVLSGISINLTSGWFGILLIAPGFLGASVDQYSKLLLINLPFGIIGLLASFWLTEKSNSR